MSNPPVIPHDAEMPIPVLKLMLGEALIHEPPRVCEYQSKLHIMRIMRENVAVRGHPKTFELKFRKMYSLLASTSGSYF